MAITKVISAGAWFAVAQNAIGESENPDLGSVYDAVVDVQAFLDSTTVHTGTKFTVQGSSHASNDRNWYDITTYVGLSTTAGLRATTDAPLAAGSTVIAMNPTGGFTALGKWIAIEDNLDITNSELIFQKAVAANVSITALDGTTIEHAATSGLYTTAEARCIYIPPAVRRVRLVVDNTYDNDGSTCNARLNVSEVTGI